MSACGRLVCCAIPGRTERMGNMRLVKRMLWSASLFCKRNPSINE